MRVINLGTDANADDFAASKRHPQSRTYFWYRAFGVDMVVIDRVQWSRNGDLDDLFGIGHKAL